jgi:hypothetical protein
LNAKTITLEKPVTLFGANISEVHVKERPACNICGSAIRVLPCPSVRAAIGSSSQRSSRTISTTFLDYGDGRTKDQGGAVIALLSFADVRAIKAALFDFFREAAATPTE